MPNGEPACPTVVSPVRIGQIDQDRPVDLLGGAEPAAGLIGEAILEVVDAHRGQRGFSEIENLVTLGRALAPGACRRADAVRPGEYDGQATPWNTAPAVPWSESTLKWSCRGVHTISLS